MSAASGVAEFRAILETAAQQHVERPAIEQVILQAIEGPNATPCTLVVGEPGSGKTSLAAALIARHGFAHYFLRRGHADFSLWSDPYAFLASLGFQLRAHFGAELFPPAVRLQVRAHARNIQAGISYTGADIEELVALPWGATELEVDLKTRDAAGEVAGVRIRRLVEDYRRIPLTAFRDLALTQPLLRLRTLRPDARLVLWVDGLDEAAAAAPGLHGALSIADILPSPPELGALGNLVLVVSCRAGPHLARLRDGAQVIDLGASRFAQDNVAVAEAYAARRLAEPAVAAGLRRAGISPEQLRHRLRERGETNFLVLHSLFQAAQDGHAAALLGSELPVGLEDVYARLARALTGPDLDRFARETHPLLAALTVAYGGLPADRLAAVARLEPPLARATLARLRPFLDVDDPGGGTPARYSLYHASFRDFLLAKPAASEDGDVVGPRAWRIEAEAAHLRMAEHGLAGAARGWESADAYTLDHLSDHLAQAGLPGRRHLRALLGPAWLRAQRHHRGSHRAFAHDLQRAAEHDSTEAFPIAVAATVRLAVMRARVESAMAAHPKAAQEALARLGQVDRALANLPPPGPARSAALVPILRGLAAGGPAGRPLLLQLFGEALDGLASNPEDTTNILAGVLHALPAGDDRLAPLLERAEQLLAEARPNWDTPWACAELGRLVTPFDGESGRGWFTTALTVLPRFATSSRGLQLGRLLKGWVAVDPLGALDAVQRLSFRGPVQAYVVEALLQVGRAAEAAGQAGAEMALREAVAAQLLPAIQDPAERACSLAALAQAEAAAGLSNAASARIAEALACTQRIGGPDDPDQASNRRSAATLALANAAAADANLDPARARATLKEGWASLASAGDWGNARDILVQAQIALDPSQLEARAAASAQSTKTLSCAALALASRDRPAAAVLLDRALLAAESPARAGGRDRLAVALAVAKAGLGHGLGALRALEAEEAAAAFVLAWGLPSGQDAALLREGLLAWSRCDNPNTVFEVPAVVAQSPTPVLEGLARDLGGLPAGPHRRILAASVGSRLRQVDPAASAALLEEADAARDVEIGGWPIPGRELLAFIAGQLGAADPAAGAEAWRRALLSLDDDASLPPDRRTYLKGRMVQALCLGAPPDQDSLAGEEAQRGFTLVVPGPGTPFLVSAGLDSGAVARAEALAREAALGPGPARQAVLELPDPALRSLALSRAAALAVSAEPALRRTWCEEAAAAANGAESHFVTCLLGAEAVAAAQVCGLRDEAREGHCRSWRNAFHPTCTGWGPDHSMATPLPWGWRCAYWLPVATRRGRCAGSGKRTRWGKRGCASRCLPSCRRWLPTALQPWTHYRRQCGRARSCWAEPTERKWTQIGLLARERSWSDCLGTSLTSLTTRLPVRAQCLDKSAAAYTVSRNCRADRCSDRTRLQAPPAYSTMMSSWLSRLGWLWRVHPSLSPEKARRARLSGMFLGTIALVGFVSLLAFVVVLGGPWNLMRWTSLAALGVLAAGFALTKTRRPELGPLLACTGLLVALGILHSMEVGTNVYVYYLAIPVLIAGLLLPRRELAVVLALLFLVLIPIDIALDEGALHTTGAELETGVFLVLVAAMALAYGSTTNRDVRALREAGQRLEQANATIQRQSEDRIRTLQQLAHDLASPLTAVMINLRLLRNDGADPKRLDPIERNLVHQRRLIDDVRDLARLEGGKLKIQREPVDLSKLAKDAVDALQPQAAERGVRLELAGESSVQAVVDAGRIHQVLVNLVGNALKFTPTGRSINVQVHGSKDRALLVVQDQGTGMGPEQLAKLFQPFSQVHDPKLVRRPEDKGTGLGLFICKPWWKPMAAPSAQQVTAPAKEPRSRSN